MERRLLDFIFYRIPQEDVLAIYLAGSRNNNLHTEQSDYDLVVIEKPTIDSLLAKKIKPKHSTDDVADYRTYDLVYFLNRVVVEGIYNDFETIYREPLYCDSSFRRISEILHKNKEVLKNKKGLIYSLHGSIYQTYQKISNESGKVNLEKIKFNKEVTNYFRYKTQLEKLIKEDVFYVIFEGDSRERFLELKTTLPASVETFAETSGEAFKEIVSEIKATAEMAHELLKELPEDTSEEKTEIKKLLIEEVLSLV